MQATARRKLIVDGFEIFTRYRRQKVADGPFRQQQLSHHYRSALESYDLDFVHSEETQVILKFVRSGWRLLEICMVNAYGHDGEFLRDIMDWLGEYVCYTKDMMLGDGASDANFDLTSLLRPLAIGRFDVVMEVLSEVKERISFRDDLEYLHVLIFEKMESFNNLGTYAHFKKEFERIQDQAATMLKIPTISSNKQLRPFFELLSGNIDVIMDEMDEWYDSCKSIAKEGFEARSNTIISTRTADFMELMRNKRERLEGETVLFKAAIEGDILKFYRIVLEKSTLDEFTILWSLTHVSHVIQEANLLPGVERTRSNPLIQIMREYVDLIRPQFLSISMAYLMYCSRDFAGELAEIVSDMQLVENEKKVAEAIEVCRIIDSENHVAERVLCERMAELKMESGNSIAALVWYSRAGNVGMTDSSAFPIVQNVILKADKDNFNEITPSLTSRSLRNLGNHCEAIRFLGNFSVMRNLYEEGNLSEAAEILLLLFRSRVPKECHVPSASNPLLLNPLVISILKAIAELLSDRSRYQTQGSQFSWKSLSDSLLLALQDAEILNNEDKKDLNVPREIVSKIVSLVSLR